MTAIAMLVLLGSVLLAVRYWPAVHAVYMQLRLLRRGMHKEFHQQDS